MFRFGCVMIVVVLVAIPTVAMYFLPLWSLPVVVLAEGFALVYVVPKLFKFGIKRFAMGLFMTKSAALRGAAVHVHAVRPVGKPGGRPELENRRDATDVVAADGTVVTTPAGADGGDDDDDADEDDDDEPDNRRYVLVDFTLTPAPGKSKMQFYEPSELMLAPFDAKVALREDPASDDRSANAHEVKLVDESGTEHDGSDKYTGRQRFRIVFACPPALSGRVKFRYYFETFGDLLLP
jgi:hypothetical protein